MTQAEPVNRPSPRHSAHRRWGIPAAAGILAVTGCGATDQSSSSPGSYEIPGEEVFPEGIGVNKSNGDFYVGSTTDGTIYRGTLNPAQGADGGALEIFLPGGQDGREAVTGIKVDGQGRLWVAGRGTGRAFVYDVERGELIQAWQTPEGERTLINDLTFASGATFFTDSLRPVIWRVEASVDEVGTQMTPWLDLSETVIPVDTSFGLNGISASDDGKVLLTVHFDTGRLFRIDVATREVSEVDLGPDLLTTGDGILLDGQILLVVREKPGAVYPVRLDADLRTGEVGEPFGEGLLLPTTIAEFEGEVLVVNSQLNDQDSPELPFTVARIHLPESVDLSE